jgi:glycerophosphoryl diester phosphodiesterase
MLYRQVKTLMGDRPYCYISFHENTITSMNEIIRKSYDKNIALYLLVNGNVNVESISIYDYCVKNNIGFSVCHTGNELLITRMKADGCKVGVWTVNDCQTAGKCVDLGVDFVVTDKVLWLD